MRVVPFTIPVPSGSSIHVQHERLPHFYEHLHRHQEVQLTYVVRGHGSLLAGSQLQPFGPGDLFLLGANMPHVFKSDPSFSRQKKKHAVEAWSIFFDRSGTLQQLLALPEMQAVRQWLDHYAGGCRIHPEEASPFRVLVQAVMMHTGAQRLAAFIQLLQALAGSRRHAALAHDSRLLTEAEGQRMNAIVQFTTRHLSRPITIDEVARQAHMTPQAFCRYFRKHTRKTYIRFLNELRIHQACQQLQQQGMGHMASIAWDCGFQHVPSFNRVFRQVMNCTPGEYVRSAGG
jgi:AraC-like DNA-binding protein